MSPNLLSKQEPPLTIAVRAQRIEVCHPHCSRLPLNLLYLTDLKVVCPKDRIWVKRGPITRCVIHDDTHLCQIVVREYVAEARTQILTCLVVGDATVGSLGSTNNRSGQTTVKSELIVIWSTPGVAVAYWRWHRSLGRRES